MFSMLTKNVLLKNTSSKRFIFMDLLQAPVITQGTLETLPIFGCNFRGDVNDYNKALQYMCVNFENETKVPLTCERFGCIHLSTSEERKPEDMEWSCFIVLDNPEIVDVLNQQSIQNHYKTDLPALRGLKTQMPYKNAYSTVVGGLRVYPSFNRYIRKHTLPDIAASMEVYSMTQQYIEYYAYLEGKEFFDHLRYKQSFVNSKDIKL